MGLTQHVNGVDNVKETVNLLLQGGHIGGPVLEFARSWSL